MNLTPPPAATAPNLQALREAYRRDKAALVATLFAPLPTVRGIHGLLRKFTRLADRLLQTLWKASALPPGLALLAVGGFGRGQLLPYSDVDVLVLLPDSSHAALGTDTRARVEDFIRNCWDAGLEIGSSVRSVQECLEEAAGDVTVQTSLLEARRICGSASLFAHFEREFRASIDPRAFLTAKTLEMRQRHNKYENTAYALEPNAKESPGGLRDLQTILWVADAAGLGQGWRALAASGLATPYEMHQLERNEAVLLLVRARLHAVAGRREDRLVFDLQTAVAEAFGYRSVSSDGLHLPMRPSETLMRRYYWAA